MSLDGKKALVTGGRRNIGRGIALALAQAGCDVGINDLERDADADRTLELIRESGARSRLLPGRYLQPGTGGSNVHRLHRPLQPPRYPG